MKDYLTNLMLSLVGAHVLVLFYQPTDWRWFAAIVILSLPYKRGNNLIAFWGGVAPGHVNSVCGFYQKAGMTAVNLGGVCFYQKAEGIALLGVNIVVFQEAETALQGMCLSYSQVGTKLAHRGLGFGMRQSAPVIYNRLLPKRR